ncbi:MAG: hypothetical protein HKN07_04840 [Acidimicrobiia bacterium]|nr:hypothetical protein [Acidimicrobiia bacterium]
MNVVLAQTDGRGFFDGVRDGLDSAWADVVAFAPKLIGAAIILLVGWIVARVIRGIFVRVLDRVGLDKLLERAGLTQTLRSAGYTASQLVGNVLYWVALLVVFLMAAEALQVERLTDLISALIAYLPLVAVAMIIIVVTAAIGAFLADLVAPWANRQQIAWLVPAVRFSIIAFGVIAALNTLNVAETVVNTLFTAIVATAGLMIAIAGGVGGIKRAEAMWWSALPEKSKQP